MPIINGVKYACEPCMRGHRSSKCTHDDRLLVRVRKPGRPLSSCPHLPSGPGGVTTFVDAHGARLDSTPTPHAHHAGKPCGCEVTSLAIPKISTCACSSSITPQISKESPSITPVAISSPLPGGFHNYGQINTPSNTSSSLQMSPVSPGSVYSSTTDASSSRRPRIHKKRKSISVNGEAILDLASRHNSITNMPNIGIGKHTLLEQQTTHIHNDGEHPNQSTFREIHSWDVDVSTNAATSKDRLGQMEILGNVNSWAENCWENKVEIAPNQIPKTNGQINQELSHDPGHLENRSLVAPKQNSGCGGCKSKAVNAMNQNTGTIPTTALQQYAAMGQFRPNHSFNYQSPATPFPTYHDQMQQMQPIATTIYTYPNGYTTVNNPLTPQELSMLQSSGAWLSPAAAAAWTGNSNEVLSLDAAHSCSCGPGCECLGCAAHPFNSNTVKFVKDMRTMMYSHSGRSSRRKNLHDDVSALTAGRKAGGCCGSNNVNRTLHSPSMHGNPMHHPEHATNLTNSIDFANMPIQSLGSPALHPMHPSDSPMSTHRNSAASSPMLDNSHAVRTHHCRSVVPTNMSSPAYTSESSPDAILNEDDTETEQHSVSPSAYFHIDYPLGLCSENDMSCMCGDDCTCIGCLIHGNKLSMPLSHEGTDDANNAHHSSSVSQERIIPVATTTSSNTGGCCGKSKAKSQPESPREFDVFNKSGGTPQSGDERSHNLGQHMSQQLNLSSPIGDHFHHHKPAPNVDGLSAFAWG